MVNQLKNISIDLQQFMKHSVGYLTHFTPNILSPVSVSLISTLFTKIHNAYMKWYFKFNIILNTKTNWQSSSTPSEYNSIPELIRKNIENIKREIIFQHRFTLEIGDKTFYVFLWFPTFIKTTNQYQSTILMSDIQIQEKVNRILQKIYIWLSIATSYINRSTCSKTVNIYLYLTDHKKMLPNSETHPILQINANTAFTTGCIHDHTNIYIYREEEWFKVLMHETMHNLGLDFIKINNEQVNHKIHQTFPISVSDIRLYETYAEMWANIMNILFVVYFTDTPSKKGRLPIVRWTQLFTKRLYLEQLFSLFQATKILCFHKLKYSDLFVVEKAQLYKEETQVFCYYILKSIWLLNINSFLEFCVSQKRGVSLKFYSSQHNLDKYLNILIRNSRQPLYINSMNEMYIYYTEKLQQGKEKDNKKNIPFAKNTLRMTLQELL